MRNAVLAVLLSLAVHLALALALVWALRQAPDAACPQLDLTSVELSLNEAEADPDRNKAARADDTAPPPPSNVATPPSAPKPPILPAPREAPQATPSPPKEPPSKPIATPPSPPSIPASDPAPPAARVEAPPRPRQTIRPRYPKAARRRGEQGDVTLELSVTAEGAVTQATILHSSGFTALDEAAKDAAKGALFSPATANGHAIPAQVRLTLSFRLTDLTR